MVEKIEKKKMPSLNIKEGCHGARIEEGKEAEERD